MKRPLHCLLMATVAMAVVACGQTGPLVLPDRKPAPAATPAGAPPPEKAPEAASPQAPVPEPAPAP